MRTSRKRRIAIGLIGIASGLCVFLSDFPYCLLPFAIFLYVFLPGGESTKTSSQRSFRSSSLRRRSAALKSPVQTAVRILDPLPGTNAQRDDSESQQPERMVEQETA